LAQILVKEKLKPRMVNTKDRATQSFKWISMVMLILALANCKSVCDKVTCLHSGSCDEKTVSCNCQGQYDGVTCDTLCSIGYEGDHCDTLSKAKFLGSWDYTAISIKDTASGAISFIDLSGAGNYANMTMFNFNNKHYKVKCTIQSKTSFLIDEYSTGGKPNAQVSASANLKDPNTLILYLNEDGINYQATCKRH
jgi:hypothetical protein